MSHGCRSPFCGFAGTPEPNELQESDTYLNFSTIDRDIARGRPSKPSICGMGSLMTEASRAICGFTR